MRNSALTPTLRPRVKSKRHRHHVHNGEDSTIDSSSLLIGHLQDTSKCSSAFRSVFLCKEFKKLCHIICNGIYVILIAAERIVQVDRFAGHINNCKFVMHFSIAYWKKDHL